MKKKKRASAKPPSADSPSACGDPAQASVVGFPIVGIGASAGGLAAFEAFFSGMPADPGMAFVLVQHLAPDHKSILCDLIRRYTRMQVFEVEDGMPVQINCVYIIPPGRDMAFLNGTLHLLEPGEPHGQRLPIDFFFRSLAQDQHERAIGIVLSGTGSDGTLGVRAIKGEGGMVIAQTPDSCEYDGMPRSAIATGLVDYELPPAEMAARLIAYAVHAFGRPPRPGAVASPGVGSAMKKIFILLRAQTGHDFSQYKPSTIHRRIERRMALQQIESLDDYVKFSQRTATEVEALFRDLLIGVTNFFRDPQAFQVLEEEAIPKLFAGRPANEVIRIWSAGCSTGEEAYSLAILLVERMEVLKQTRPVQVFANDIDSAAIAVARAGIYPASIAADISPERLARFFTAEPGGSYRIHKGLRDLLVFSEHDVIKDPPFSKLDLISCRNLLIYMDADLQKKLLPIFHYALKPGGILFLGTSEGVGEADAMFEAMDRKMKIYRAKGKFPDPRWAGAVRFSPQVSAADFGARSAAKPAFPAKLPLRELAEHALLQQVVAAAALVNSQGDILYLHGRSGMFLEPATGEAGANNILRMAREGLRDALATGLRKAAATNDTVGDPGLRVKTNGDFTTVNLTVRPVTGAAAHEPPLFLVVLEEAPEPPDRSDLPDLSDARIAALKQELRAKEEYLQSANEELQSSTEELKSSNEERQSVNEELATVNNELQIKVTDLSRANNDMNNLLAGTRIATVFVDHQMRILRFTPTASEIINLILSDVGRPLAHIVSNLVGCETLLADVKSVLDTLAHKEAEVQTAGGRWFKMQIQPYRTLENVIEGAVVSFVDITEIVRIREALREANEQLRLAVVVRDARDAITVQDLDGRTIAWNPAAARMYGWSEAEALAMNVRDRIPQPLRQGAMDTLRRLSHAEILEPYPAQRLAKDGASVEVSITSTALLNEAGEMYAIATTERPTREANIQCPTRNIQS